MRSDLDKSSNIPLKAAELEVERSTVSVWEGSSESVKVVEVPADRELSSTDARAYYLSSGSSPSTYIVELGHDQKDSPPLVLIHGLGDAGVRDFYSVVKSLSVRRRVILVELPGLGRSELGASRPEPLVFASRVRQVIQARITGAFDLLGHSLGGAVALLVAAGKPDNLRRLVLVDVAGILHQDAFVGSQIEWMNRDLAVHHEGGARALGLLGRKMVVVSQWIRPSDGTISWGTEQLTGIQAQAALALIQQNLAPALRSLRSTTHPKTLIVWGTRDNVAPLRSAELLASLLQDSELRLLEGVGHVPMLEVPAQFSQDVGAFLDDAGTSNSSLAASPLLSGARPQSGKCLSQEAMVFTGRFSTLVIEDCEDILLDQVIVERLVIRDSEVDISRPLVTSGIVAIESEIRLTGGSVSGQIALLLSESEADVAGTLLLGAHAAVQSQGESDFLGSAVLLDGPRGEGSLHGHVVLKNGEGF